MEKNTEIVKLEKRLKQLNGSLEGYKKKLISSSRKFAKSYHAKLTFPKLNHTVIKETLAILSRLRKLGAKKDALIAKVRGNLIAVHDVILARRHIINLKHEALEMALHEVSSKGHPHHLVGKEIRIAEGNYKKMLARMMRIGKRMKMKR